ncbi:TPA: hypothetical protein HMU52_16780 [Escherichia coli]|uniref:Uncharacterized protein n=3 Tax=Enterobacteriaceae TaxID=543 RepID=A0A6N9SF53_ECOLX|nr:hypothetical protein B1T56_18790 [Escherichia coli]EAV0034529.1 hypothetical protein [Salmonella enterica]EBH3484102.1 hypothetical protein [Salmonella enterica subsp. enterica serovar Haifa]EBU7866107.1 hypothetical protein [Salmonella enterica subsp. enterica serovar Kentucky]HAB1446190.1 hypothetical protein [Salmonella enterica subsp. enterica serovar Mbandaka]
MAASPPLPAGNHLPGVFGWSGYSCLVISKIIAINSGKLIVHNLVMNITLIFPCPEESEAVTQGCLSVHSCLR